MPATTRPKVLLIGWDGADWEHIQPLLDEGLMPRLAGMISNGVMGNIATLYPILSPMLWNSVATGKLADEHGILGFSEPDTVNGGARPFSSTSRKVKAIWNILSQQGLRSNVVNWWASYPAEPIRGAVVANTFARSPWSNEGWQHPPGTFHPAGLRESLGSLRVRLTEITQNEILPFIPRAAEIDQAQDRNLEAFSHQLAQCISVQAAGTWLMEHQQWDFSAIYYEAIDHFCHAFMPFAPPKMPNVSQKQYEIYKDVIRGAYRFHDMMLGRLLSLVDEDTYVMLCSDHGFLSGTRRPAFTPREPAGPAYWHRPLGIFAMQGPGIRRDSLVFGASLLDIAPTILTLFGLPFGEDMAGRPLLDAFEKSPQVRTIPSWEPVDGECGRHVPGFVHDRDASRQLMDQFVALGYIEDPGDDLEEAQSKAKIEIQYNLARVYLSTNRAEQALKIFQILVETSPWENRFVLNLARSYYECSYFRQAERVLHAAYPTHANRPAVVLTMLGRILIRLGETDEGLSLLRQAEAKQSTLAGLHIEIARTYQNQRRWTESENACRKELEMNPDSAEGHGLLALAQLRGRQDDAAFESALTAVTLKHWYPKAHYILGLAAARLGWYERSERALRTAVAIQPKYSAAHRLLALVYRRLPERQQAARRHRELATESRTSFRAVNRQLQERAEQTFDLPDIQSPRERLERVNAERPRRRRKPDERQVATSGKTFVIVSGLPRSGTSLMMQMLQAGGLPAMTDGHRLADDDNPEGYYEWEAIKQIAKRPELFDDEGISGKAIKVISQLLQSLPRQHQYKVVFMMRPILEVAASQTKMLERNGNHQQPLDGRQLERQLTVHRNQVLRWLRGSEHVELLEVDYPSLVRDTREQVPRIVEHVGSDRLPNAEAMTGIVRPALHRQRAENR